MQLKQHKNEENKANMEEKLISTIFPQNYWFN
jgi:hypothetical protein